MCKTKKLKFKFSLNASEKTSEVFLVLEEWPTKIEYYVVDVTKHLRNEKNFQSALSEQITQHLSVEGISFHGFIENRNKETCFVVLGAEEENSNGFELG